MKSFIKLNSKYKMLNNKSLSYSLSSCNIALHHIENNKLNNWRIVLQNTNYKLVRFIYHYHNPP
jgi:hypothetical protein